MRVIHDCGPLFSELENCLSSSFIPALFGVEVSLAEYKLFSLPLREGGQGILVLLLYPIIVSSHHSSPQSFLDTLFFSRFHLSLMHILILSNCLDILISSLSRISLQQPILI